MMSSKLFRVLAWAKGTGEIKVLNRIQMRVFSRSIKESLYLKNVQETTTCSEAYLKEVVQAAEEVVGKHCPIRI